MENKRILGFDLGTNSIGWALIEQASDGQDGKILGMGSRIIPMSKDVMDNFGAGQSHSQTAERTSYRGVRRLNERDLLRRERLHRVLNVLGFLPAHYSEAIDFEKRKGQFLPVDKTEIKLNYKVNEQGKHQFIFKKSFEEMAELFKDRGVNKVPYDWTIYYLRNKALTHAISKEELAWLILNFNQKRGYYQLRGEEEIEEDGKTKEYHVLKVKSVIDSGERVKGDALYDVVFEHDDWPYDKHITKTENWIGKTHEFIVTTSTNKDGGIKRSFKKVNAEEDWIAIKKKTEQDIDRSKKSLGTYIFDRLLENPTQKINGQLVKTIERKYYKDELIAILNKQKEFHPELLKGSADFDRLYSASIEELYARNEPHRNNLKDQDFTHLFVEDIIFYQRPLKSKKSTISTCPYEYKSYSRNGESQKEALKCIHKSNPYFQEFRLWQFIANLKIFKKNDVIDGKSIIDVDVTGQLLPSDKEVVELFEYLNDIKELEQKKVIDYFVKQKKIPKTEKDNYRWNYIEDRKYPGNETRASILAKIKKVEGIEVTWLTTEIEQELWHIIYSVKDRNEYIRALNSFARKKSIHVESFEAQFKRFKPFDNDYGAYSEKAIKKLLPLMRRGKYWNESLISDKVKNRIAEIKERLETISYDIEVFKKDEKKRLAGIVDDDIPKQLLKSFVHLHGKNHLSGLNTYQACYLVYERHSEVSQIIKWQSPADIAWFLNPKNPIGFKQHSLRNPIVEQVVTETLRVVREIWSQYGNDEPDYFDEIHIELGRDMKNPKKKREAMSRQNTERENTNERIKAILNELSGARSHSPSHQEILKIYEEGVVQNPGTRYDQLSEKEVETIQKTAFPSKAQIDKYKLWLEQGYISPYTGLTIPLGDLFSHKYQIEHIIPQSRYFDNSLNNKVICESEINEKKSNDLGYEFISKAGGSIIGGYPVLSVGEYEAHCNHYFRKNRTKLKNLLADEVPEGFINRQMNDSRYISKYIMGLLSNIVRENDEKEATSKNIIPLGGAITSKLKNDWGLNDKWNELVAPRFMRLNEMTQSKKYGDWDPKINAFRCQVPEETTQEKKSAQGFSKKRIDHRHHALDALVIACCTRKHTQYLNSLNNEKEKHALRPSLLIQNKQGDYTKHFKQPWRNFPMDAKSSLEGIVVSFKQNTRVITKTNNKTWQWVEQPDGKYKRALVSQTKGDHRAIRKPLHKDTISGSVTIKRQKKGLADITRYIADWEMIMDKAIRRKMRGLWLSLEKDEKLIKKHLKKNPFTIGDEVITKIEVYEKVEAKSTRGIATVLDEKFNRKKLEAVSDSGIRLIFENHIKNYLEVNDKGETVERFDLAFSQNGLEEMNKHIVSLNNGKFHHPIYKVRSYEISDRFVIGENANKKTKYAEAAKGTNLFFAIYWNEEKKARVYETIPLNAVVAHQKWRTSLPKEDQADIPMIPINVEKGRFMFSLSPNDLVYVPTDEEIESEVILDSGHFTKEQTLRIYKMVSSNTYQCFFVPQSLAQSIADKKEFSVLNKMEKSIDGKMIKSICMKLKIDKLGNVKQVIK